MSFEEEKARASPSEAVAGGGGAEREPEEIMYKTKTIQFLGRSTPIVLQNDNGPCPLLAICNVLLLKNSLNLSVDASEVSLQRLLSLVAEKLIDSNTNVQDKDEEYLINQQQNIADAIDLLPRLSTGIDVNVQFRKINDFEFTRECAIFDLLDIGLYHGWIVDPQDTDTASAIGSKSYNTLVGELVDFEARKSAGEYRNLLEEDSVDFVAATTAALGVPSPSLSRGRSFDDCQVSVLVDQGRGKGDREETGELMRALNLSKVETSITDKVSTSVDANSSHILEICCNNGNSGSGSHHVSSVAQTMESEESQQDLVASQQCNTSTGFEDGGFKSTISSTENNVFLSNTNVVSKVDGLNSTISLTSNDVFPSNANIVSTMDHSISEESRKHIISSDRRENACTDVSMPDQVPSFLSVDGEGSVGKGSIASKKDPSFPEMCDKDLVISQIQNMTSDNSVDSDSVIFPVQDENCTDFHLANGGKELPDVSEVGSSSFDDSEPIYEGEECILESGHMKYEDREPVYEGEIVLAQQADEKNGDASAKSKDEVGLEQCRLIRNFLENSASQLTIYGLFCLQEGLKERELCVFFRNNHFNTMFKFNGELYILATDQGYINQPDLVWEKLNEVNGDTVFMTGNFTEFKIENQVSESWNEQNAMTSTADYLATLEASAPAPTSSSFNSDLQLAIALQQQEFGQQSQQQTQHPQQQVPQRSAASGRSGLVTGPQVPRSSRAPAKTESKKDKCAIM